MTELAKILKGVDILELSCSLKLKIRDIQTDSRKIKKGDLFVARKGCREDGNFYINDAYLKGASAILTQEKTDQMKENYPLIVVEDIDSAFGIMLNNYYPNLIKTKIIGVTGTNGKTTVAVLLKNILEASGKKCGLIGTLGCKVHKGKLRPLNNTTPGALEISKIINQMYKKKVKYVVMEVSSHALSQGRVDHLKFTAGIFTNLSQDHLDYHKNMENYLEAKLKLFETLGSHAKAVLNIDDAAFMKIKKALKAECISYGFNPRANYKARNVSLALGKLKFEIKSAEKTVNLESRLTGRHNVYNILAAASCALELRCGKKALIQAVSETNNIPGRLQMITAKNGALVYIDYAHTPDAIKNITSYLSDIKEEGARLICLFGCGGNRDKTKRPKMAKEAVKNSDILIITSDNPRDEKPASIIKDIKRGINSAALKKSLFIENRYEAIKKAIAMAQDKDIVLIAGKGHEDVQIIGKESVPFSDYKIAKSILNGK